MHLHSYHGPPCLDVAARFALVCSDFGLENPPPLWTPVATDRWRVTMFSLCWWHRTNGHGHWLSLGVAAAAPSWCLGCLLNHVVDWAGSQFSLFGMLNCSLCKNKTKIYIRKRNRKNASIRQKLRVDQWTCCCLHAIEAYTNPPKSRKITCHQIILFIYLLLQQSYFTP